MSREHARYTITCACGNTGRAEWSENDGASFLNRGPETVVEIAGDFLWETPVPDGPRCFHGRELICKRCGQQPETREAS